MCLENDFELPLIIILFSLSLSLASSRFYLQILYKKPFICYVKFPRELGVLKTQIFAKSGKNNCVWTSYNNNNNSLSRNHERDTYLNNFPPTWLRLWRQALPFCDRFPRHRLWEIFRAELNYRLNRLFMNVFSTYLRSEFYLWLEIVLNRLTIKQWYSIKSRKK